MRRTNSTELPSDFHAYTPNTQTCKYTTVIVVRFELVFLCYFCILEQVQDSIWKDEGQVHTSCRHANPHQSQEGLLERQWCEHPFLLSPAATGRAAVIQQHKLFHHSHSWKSLPTTWIRKEHILAQYQSSKVAKNCVEMLQAISYLVGNNMTPPCNFGVAS